MKRIILLFTAMLMAFAASAQYANTPALRVKRSTVYLDGKALAKDAAADLFGSEGDKYLTNRKGYKVGLGLSVGGASLTAVSGVTFLISSAVTAVVAPFSALGQKELPKGLQTTLIVSAGGFFVGVATMLAGIPTVAVYQSRIKKQAMNYNQSLTVSFGAQSSGMGLAIRF